MSRKRKILKLKPVLFIACEGTNTEFDYFDSWAKTDQALEYFESINVYPGKVEINPQTNPYQLFEKAKQALDDGLANFVWVVFDKDNHPKLSETFAEAQIAGVKIAFSSRSFEEWVLLHFEKNHTEFNATECKNPAGKSINCGSLLTPDCIPTNCLTGHIRRQNFLPDYSKKKTFDLFSAINKRTEIAVVNAAWLRFQIKASLNIPQPPLKNLNPYTDVDQLICKIQDRSDKIEWGIAGKDISVCNLIINAHLDNDIIAVKFSHSNSQSLPINDIFPLPNFFTTDDDLNDTPCNFVSKTLVVSQHGSLHNLLFKNDIVEFKFQSNNQPYFLFNDFSSGVRIFVIL
jgi:hypothetical protein